MGNRRVFYSRHPFPKLDAGVGSYCRARHPVRVAKRARVMGRIMIRCPMFDQPVPTGLTTEMIKLDSLSIPFNSLTITLTLRCPACNELHIWKHKDAWVEEEG